MRGECNHNHVTLHGHGTAYPLTLVQPWVEHVAQEVAHRLRVVVGILVLKPLCEIGQDKFFEPG